MRRRQTAARDNARLLPGTIDRDAIRRSAHGSPDPDAAAVLDVRRWRCRSADRSRGSAPSPCQGPRAKRESTSTVAKSLQCRSSRTRAHGRMALSASRRLQNSRNMRSRVAPNTSCWNAVRSVSSMKPGMCSSQVGAWVRIATSSSAPSGAATAGCQRVNQRQKGFIGTEPLGAASAQQIDTLLRQPLHRHVDERRLADSRPPVTNAICLCPVSICCVIRSSISRGASRPTMRRDRGRRAKQEASRPLSHQFGRTWFR